MASMIDKYKQSIHNKGGKLPRDYRDDPRDMKIAKLSAREKTVTKKRKARKK